MHLRKVKLNEIVDELKWIKGGLGKKENFFFVFAIYFVVLFFCKFNYAVTFK